MELEERVIKFIKSEGMLTNVHNIGVATSGGADSMALLTFLHRNRNILGINDVIAIHVNHGIRGETADRDELFVVDYCKLNTIKYIAYNARRDSINIPDNASESWARDLRYNYFDKAKIEYGYDKLAVAHTASDQAETVLFRLARGTGLKGIGGIQSKRGSIIRPFMCLDREDIEDLCRYYGIQYITDETNLGDTYARNKIRHNVIPTLKKVNSKAVFNLVETSQKVMIADRLVTKLGKAILGKAILDKAGLEIDISILDRELQEYRNSLNLDDGDILFICEYIAIEIVSRLMSDVGYTTKKTKNIIRLISDGIYNHNIRSITISSDSRLELVGSILRYIKEREPRASRIYEIKSCSGDEAIRVEEMSLREYLLEIIKPELLEDGKLESKLRAAMHSNGNLNKFILNNCDTAMCKQFTGLNCTKGSIEVVFGDKVSRKKGIYVDNEYKQLSSIFKECKFRGDICVAIYKGDKVQPIWVNGVGIGDRYRPTVKDKVVYRIKGYKVIGDTGYGN